MLLKQKPRLRSKDSQLKQKSRLKDSDLQLRLKQKQKDNVLRSRSSKKKNLKDNKRRKSRKTHLKNNNKMLWKQMEHLFFRSRKLGQLNWIHHKHSHSYSQINQMKSKRMINLS